MSNEDDQSDEIMALQSIYGEDIFACDNNEKPFVGVAKIAVDYELEEYNFICNGHQVLVEHLSPVVLNFSLPPNYPTECPPDVTLSCLWLTSQQLEDLSNILKDYWKESCSVVLFSWMDLIKTELFKLLDVKFPVEISEENIMKLTEIDLLREEENFKNDFHVCPICFLEFHGLECVRLSNCGHVFCKECLAGFLSVCISDGNVKFLICPAEECEEEIYQHVIKNVISEAEYEKYERLLLHKTLSIMQDIQYCPRSNCGKPVIVEDDDLGFCHCCNFAFCIKCNSTYHGVDLCKKEREKKQTEKEKEISTRVKENMVFQRRAELEHFIRNPGLIQQVDKKKRKALENATIDLKKQIVKERRGLHDMYKRLTHEESQSAVLKIVQQRRILTKEETEIKNLVESYMNGDDQVKQKLISSYGKAKIDEVISEHWVLQNSQKCPSCSACIERSFGCNHMTCGVCKTHFCWLCRTVLRSKNPYKHFSDPSSPCFNLLAPITD